MIAGAVAHLPPLVERSAMAAVAPLVPIVLEGAAPLMGASGVRAEV